MCRSLHAEAKQSTASEGLAEGPYVAERAGFVLHSIVFYCIEVYWIMDY